MYAFHPIFGIGVYKQGKEYVQRDPTKVGPFPREEEEEAMRAEVSRLNAEQEAGPVHPDEEGPTRIK